MSDTGNIARDLSIGLSQAVKQAAGFTVGVDGRGGYPSSGVFYDSSLVLTADHTVDREEDIEILLADGSKQNSKVAGRDPLRVSEHTVKFHVSSIFTKLGATNRVEAVRVGIRIGLLDL